MISSVMRAILTLLIAAASASAATDPKAARAFQELFGAEARKVAATSGTTDDVRFAATLLDAATLAGKQTGLRTLLCEKAVEFASRNSAGYKTAVAAIGHLMKVAPARDKEWQEKLLAVYQTRYRRSDRRQRSEQGKRLLDQLVTVGDAALSDGDADKAKGLYQRALSLARLYSRPDSGKISACIKVAVDKLTAQRMARALEARLEVRPADMMVRTRLIHLYVLELDSPARAAKFLTDGVDDTLRRNVSMAAKEAEELTKAATLGLAQWYDSLAPKASKAARPAVLSRAAQYYRNYLTMHPAEDMTRLKAKLALRKIEKALAAAGGRQKGMLKKIVLDLGKGATMTVALIPAGTFVMGCPPAEMGKSGREQRQHKVKISRAFYVGVTEVTQKQYAAVMGANPSKHQGEKYPVENVSWNEAVAFCRTVSAKTVRPVRLPTEAEWEYACRAGTTTRWFTGNTEASLAGYAWYKKTSGAHTHVVAESKPNAFGLHDMTGNVFEWCLDYYRSGYDPKASPVDPTGPVKGTERVLRGGSFWYDAGWCSSANRRGYSPESRWSNVGFRVVVETGDRK